MMALLRPAFEQNHQFRTVPTEVDPVTRVPVDPALDNPAADRFQVGQIARSDALDRRLHPSRRLLEPIGNIPRAEAEARYHAQTEVIARAA